jgi:hypothetical protein
MNNIISEIIGACAFVGCIVMLIAIGAALT